jgi:glycosyltransferase involved in cell wall biosynthesis
MTAAADRLRIALLLESDGPGGAERVLLDLAEALRAWGHEVCPVGPATGCGWLAGEFVRRDFQPESFTLRHPLDWRCATGLADTLRRRRIDVVHSHEFTMAVFGTVAARLVRRPHVITFHGSQTMTRAFRRRAALRQAIRWSHCSVAVSDATRRQLVADLGGTSDRIGVVLNGVPVRSGTPDGVRRELGIREGEVVVLAVGNLDRRKGHAVLLQALIKLHREGLAAPWRLVIAGGRGGPEREPLLDLARESGLEGRLNLLAQRDDIPDLLAAADVFAMPSLWEGLPLALLEAMVAGKPILASDTSGIPEAVRQGIDGFLTPPGDVESLAAALRRVLDDPATRARLAGAARERGHREFTIDRVAGDYERLYRGGRSGAPD